ncbi:MAG: S-layer homology domain-containing protein [Bacteroidota bacterium]
MSIAIKFKKFVAAAAVTTLIFSMFGFLPSVSAKTFNDVTENDWFYEYVEKLVEKGVITAGPTYRPNEILNRAELVKIAIEATTGPIMDLPKTPSFDDVAVDAWYFPYVESAVALGVVEGYRDASGSLTGLFGPSDPVTRAAAVKIFSNAFGLPTPPASAQLPFNDVREGDWFYPYVLSTYCNSVVSGYTDAAGELTGKFGPGDPITRAQVAKITVNADNPVAICGEETGDDTTGDDTSGTGDTTGDDTVQPEGDLDVVRDSDYVYESYDIPSNAASVIMLPLELTAGASSSASTNLTVAGGVQLYGVSVTRQGLGDNNDIDQVWLEDADGNVISNSASVNNDDLAVIRLKKGGILIPSGESVKLYVVASFDVAAINAAGRNHRFTIMNADNIESSAANISGAFPIQGDLFTIANYQTAELVFQAQGAARTIEVGSTQTEVGRFKLTNDGGANNKSLVVTRLTLRNIGSLDAQNSGNYVLYLGSTAVSAPAEMTADDYVTFDFTMPVALDNNGAYLAQTASDGMTLGNNNSKDLTAKADIYGADGQGNNIQLKLDDGQRDVRAYEIGTGFGVRVVDIAGATANDVNLALITVDAGDLNIARSPDSRESQTVAPATQDFDMLKVKISTATELQMKDMDVVLQVVEGAPLLVQAANVDLDEVLDNVRIVQYSADGVTVKRSVVSQADLAATRLNLIGPGPALPDIVVNMDDDFSLPKTIGRAANAGFVAGISKIAADTTTSTVKNIGLTWDILIDVKNQKIIGGVAVNYNDTTFKVLVQAADINDLEYEGSGDQVIVENVKGNAASSVFRIGKSRLRLTRTDGLTNGQNFVAGANGLKLFQFGMQNNDAQSVTVSSIGINFLNAAPHIQKQFISSVRLIVNGKQVGNIEDPVNGANAVTIDGLEIVIPKNSMVKVDVLVDLSTAIVAADLIVGRDKLQAEIEAVTAFDNNGETLATADVIFRDAFGVDQDIDVATSFDSALLDIVASGLLTQSIGGDTPESAVIVANSVSKNTEIPVATYKFASVDDNIFVSDLSFINTNSQGVKLTDAVTGGRLAKLNLYGPTKSSTAGNVLLAATEVKVSSDGVIESGDINFHPTTYIYVPGNSSVVVRVSVVTNDVSNEGQTGKNVRLVIASYKATSEASGDVLKLIKVEDETRLPGAVTTICWDLNADGDFADTGEANIAVQATNVDNLLVIAGSVDKMPAAGARVTTYVGVACTAWVAAPAPGVGTEVDGSPAANLYTIRKTKPTITNEALPNTTLTAGSDLVIHKIKVAGDENADVHLHRVTFDIALIGIALNGGTWNPVTLAWTNAPFKLYKDNGLTLVPAHVGIDIDLDGVYNEFGVDQTTGNDGYNTNIDPAGQGWMGLNGNVMRVQFNILAADNVTQSDEEIQGGYSKVYELKATNPIQNVLASVIDGDSITTKLTQDTAEDLTLIGTPLTIDNTVTLALAKAAGEINYTLWSDESTPGHTIASPDWTNGFLLKYPTTGNTRNR